MTSGAAAAQGSATDGEKGGARWRAGWAPKLLLPEAQPWVHGWARDAYICALRLTHGVLKAPGHTRAEIWHAHRDIHTYIWAYARVSRIPNIVTHACMYI